MFVGKKAQMIASKAMACSWFGGNMSALARFITNEGGTVAPMFGL